MPRLIHSESGWVTVFAWQATATSLNYLIAAQIQGLVVLNFSDSYVFQRWHGTLLMWAISLVVLVINIWSIKLLPAIEMLAGICHVVFFVVLLVTLVVLAPKSSPEFVFTTLISDQSGWNNPGISWCIGLLTVTWCFVGMLNLPLPLPPSCSLSPGFDGAIHLSEEVRNSAVTVPRIIIWTIVINGTMAFAFLIAILFCIGNVENALNTPTGFPIIEIFYQATGSKTAATLMETCLIIIAFAASIANLASVSRLTWAFARDGGLPFSNFFSFVNTSNPFCSRSPMTMMMNQPYGHRVQIMFHHRYH
jgi:choline transport protein